MPEEIDRESLAGIEAALGGLTPPAPGLDRDRLMYRAGRATAVRPSRMWPCATALAATIAMALGLRLGLSSNVTVVERVVYREADYATGTLSTGPTKRDTDRWHAVASYFSLRDAVLTDGVDALPSDDAPGGRSPDNGPMRLQRGTRPLDIESWIELGEES